MGWATNYINKLIEGETVKFRPRGNSMTGKINSGQLVTVEPVGDREISKGDIVLCKVGSAQYLHIVHAVKSGGNQFTIGNNHGRVNGTISRNGIFGICTNVED